MKVIIVFTGPLESEEIVADEEHGMAEAFREFLSRGLERCRRECCLEEIPG